MMLATIVFVGLTAFIGMMLVGQRTGVFASDGISTSPIRPTSPLDEAERILAHRYATGQVSAEEYNRMLVILRR